MKISVLAAGVALALAASTAAFAADGNIVQVRASVGGLDLSQDNGARTMLRRIDNAATEACGASRFSLAPVRRAARNSECHRDAMASAVQRLSAPKVTSLYNTDFQTLAAN